MLIHIYNYVHDILGIHFWDIPAIIVLVVIAVIAILHTVRQKKRENDFEDEMKRNENKASGREGAL